MEDIRNYLEKFVRLNPAEWEAFRAKLVAKQFHKEELFLSEGQICNHAVFISSGAFRFYKIIEGNEVVTALFFKGDFLSDYQSFLTSTPSNYFIQAIKESNVYMISKDDLTQLYHSFQTFERLGRLFAERLFLTMNKRLDSFLYETPEERYAELTSRNAKLLQEVPQYMIASYLGIKPETLSRIRKRK